MAVLTTAEVHSPSPRHPERRTGRWLALLLLLLANEPDATAQPTATREYQVKAVFLFNFAQFVEWPPEAFATPESPIIIGVLGDDPFGPVLDETVRGEMIGVRSLQVRRYRQVGEIETCHMLYIGKSERKLLEQTVSALKSRSILTVGDSDGYARRGVMIRFVTDKNRVRLRINLNAARAAGLTISSKMLRPAEIVASFPHEP